MGDTVEELKRFNARRKLKGAVQAVAGGIAMDPFCGADTDSGMIQKKELFYKPIRSKLRGIVFSIRFNDYVFCCYCISEFIFF